MHLISFSMDSQSGDDDDDDDGLWTVLVRTARMFEAAEISSRHIIPSSVGFDRIVGILPQHLVGRGGLDISPLSC